MRIIQTASQDPKTIDAMEREWTYNGLDSAVTLECFDAMQDELDDHTAATYAFSKALQGPVLEMRLRGCLIDQARKAEVIDEYYAKIEILEHSLERIVREGVGMPGFNWRSNQDLQALFYGRLGIPPILRGGKPTTDRDAREKLENYILARPIAKHVSLMWDIQKKIDVLKTGIDPDGRMRTSINIAGTSTGRFSSSFSEFGTGGNLQNIEESLRSIFIADPGYKLAKCDAKSGESFLVGGIEWNLFGDDRYLSACESGDPHTAVARICWPHLPWTGDFKRDKDIAEQPYYRHYSYRFMCKKLGHGSNYGGKPATLAAQTKLPIEVVKDFQPKYFTAFPAHRKWHEAVDTQLRRHGYIVSLMQRKRYFFGRRNSEDTYREALAYDPQEGLATVVNRAMLRIWRGRVVIIWAHDHDALTFMYPEELEDEIIPQVMAMLPETRVLRDSREMRIPYDCKTGWNKGDYNASTNPDGLKDYTIGKSDSRRRSPPVSLLDRPVRRRYG
jgi:DNA polymerase I